jgi:hypothetical protein
MDALDLKVCFLFAHRVTCEFLCQTVLRYSSLMVISPTGLGIARNRGLASPYRTNIVGMAWQDVAAGTMEVMAVADPVREDIMLTTN